jgi:hypothetical protein
LTGRDGQVELPDESDPADAARRDQPQALALVKDLGDGLGMSGHC